MGVRSKREQLRIRFNKFRFWLKTDVLNFNNLLLLSIPLLFTVLLIASVGSIAKNWELQQQMNAKQTEMELLKLDVNKTKLENQYFASDEYQELEARRLLGKKLPEETMIDLPNNSEIAKNKHPKLTLDERIEARKLSNSEQWLEFLFGTMKNNQTK
jgi:hypothetical protein